MHNNYEELDYHTIPQVHEITAINNRLRTTKNKNVRSINRTARLLKARDGGVP